MSFASPLFLIGLIAVAIPIIVHLFNFRRYKKVYFSNVDQLEQLQTETRRQSNLRQLLILAARILAIVFLVLAFARPVLSSGDKVVRAGANDVSIFIDNSFSMENSDGNGIILDKAKVKAREIVAAYAPSDRFQLLTSDMEGRQFHWLSKEEMLSAIDEVQIGGSSAMLSDAAGRQADFLHGGRGQNRYAYLISDFQAAAVDMDAMSTDSSVQITFVPLTSTSSNNVYIDSIAIGSPAIHIGNSVTVRVWIANEGDENLDKVPVSLFVNDKQRALATIDLPSRSTSTVELHFVVDQSGVLSCRVETEDYPVTFDNEFFFSLNVRSRVDCLIVDGTDRNPFLASLFEGDSSVRCSSMSLRQMDFSNLDGHDMILLDEPSSITSGMAQALLGFAQQGGTVVVVAADDADATSYNAALSLFSAPLLASKHSGRATAALLNRECSLYLNVFSSGEGNRTGNRSNSAAVNDIELPTVNNYWSLQPLQNSLHESIITLAGGDDYICHTPCGDGHLYLITAPLRDNHTDFVRQALFVPTLYNMALYSVRPSAPPAILGREQSLTLVGRYETEGHAVRLEKESHGSADGETSGIIPDIRSNGGVCRLVTHDSPSEAGNYLLSQDGEVREGVSFNYSRNESKMQFLENDAIQALIDDFGLNNVSLVPNPDKPIDTYLREQMEGRSLWRWCLILSLLMLLAEILLVKIKVK